MEAFSTEVIVIGGGPAGSTISTLLAKKGLSVRLFEKEKFPRPHVGESLLPFCYYIFEELGLLEEMEKRFVRKPGACFVNENGENEMTYCFNKVMEEKVSLSFHVRRDEFDQLLLNNSASNGVDVLEEHRVSNVEFLDDNVKVSVVDKNGEKKEYTAKFLIDASGRDCVVSRLKKTVEPIVGLDRVAVSSHWTCDQIPEKLRSGAVRITYLEGDHRKGWIWCIPIASDRVSMGVVVDSKFYASELKRIKQNSSDWEKDYYFEQLASAPSIKGFMEAMDYAGPIVVNGNYSYKTSVKYGDSFALVGDASQFIDPIFASGVYIAMKSAKLLSESVYSKIKTGSDTEMARSFEIIADGYKVVHELINIYYDPSSMNFATTNFAELDSSNKFSEHNQSFALIHLLLAGDFFERGSTYLPFLESLKNKKKMDRWQNLIDWDHHLSKEHNTDENCGESFEKIFQLMGEK